MKRQLIIPLLILAAALTMSAAETKPNIILIYSDDHGFADLGVQGSVQDIRTPNLDALARDGVRFKRGYVSAPQCVPSRAGVMTGRYQQRFGVEDNGKGPLPLEELTIAERLKPAGYVSCQIGKWHLDAPPERKAAKGKSAAPEGGRGPASQPLTQGFDEYFNGAMNTFAASHDLQGNKLPSAPQQLTDKRFRCVWQADAAISFIERHQRDPFFIYLAFFTPHVPLESPEPWFSKTPKDAPLERRQALAMIAAMDDGVGRLREKLRAVGIEKNTLIFFIGDNGAPLKQGAWNGSLNLPLIGEKGMLTDGGIRTPFLAAWPGKIPAGQVFESPVINLDVAATAVKVAGASAPAGAAKAAATLDGIDLMPYMLGEQKGNPHDALFWRWRSQAAVRADRWKLILLGKDERYLFDMDSPEGETKNRIAEHPDIAAELDKKLMAWNATLPPPGLPRDIVEQDQVFYDDHVNKTGIRAAKRRTTAKPTAPESSVQGWICRNGALSVKDGALIVSPDAGAKAGPFLALAGLDLSGPVHVRLRIRAKQGGTSAITWRTTSEKDFGAENSATFDWTASAEWREVSAELPLSGRLLHLRITPAKASAGIEVQSITLTPSSGKPSVFDFSKVPTAP